MSWLALFHHCLCCHPTIWPLYRIVPDRMWQHEKRNEPKISSDNIMLLLLLVLVMMMMMVMMMNKIVLVLVNIPWAPILMRIFRPFVIGIDSSWWHHVGRKSASPTLLVLRRSLSAQWLSDTMIIFVGCRVKLPLCRSVCLSIV
jgi:hypothetical protein